MGRVRASSSPNGNSLECFLVLHPHWLHTQDHTIWDNQWHCWSQFAFAAWLAPISKDKDRAFQTRQDSSFVNTSLSRSEPHSLTRPHHGKHKHVHPNLPCSDGLSSYQGHTYQPAIWYNVVFRPRRRFSTFYQSVPWVQAAITDQNSPESIPLILVS